MAKKKGKLRIAHKSGVLRGVFAGNVAWWLGGEYVNQSHQGWTADQMRRRIDPLPIYPTPGYYADVKDPVKAFRTAARLAELSHSECVPGRWGRPGPIAWEDFGQWSIQTLRDAYKSMAATDGCLSDAVTKGEFSHCPALGLAFANQFVNQPVFSASSSASWKKGVHPLCFPSSMAGYAAHRYKGVVTEDRIVHFANAINAIGWGDCTDLVFCIADDTWASGVIDVDTGDPATTATSGYDDVDSQGVRYVIQGGIVMVGTSNSYVTGRKPFRHTWHARTWQFEAQICGGTYVDKNVLDGGYDPSNPEDEEYRTVWEDARSPGGNWANDQREKRHAYFKVVEGAKAGENKLDHFVLDPYVVVGKKDIELLDSKSSNFYREARGLDQWCFDALTAQCLYVFVANSAPQALLDYNDTIWQSGGLSIDHKRQIEIVASHMFGCSASSADAGVDVDVGTVTSGIGMQWIDCLVHSEAAPTTPNIISMGPVQKESKDERILLNLDADESRKIDVLSGKTVEAGYLANVIRTEDYVLCGFQGGWNLIKRADLTDEASKAGLSPTLGAIVGGVYDVAGAVDYEMSPSLRPVHLLRTGDDLPSDGEVPMEDDHPEHGVTVSYGGLVPSSKAFEWRKWLKHHYPKLEDQVEVNPGSWPYPFSYKVR